MLPDVTDVAEASTFYAMLRPSSPLRQEDATLRVFVPLGENFRGQI